MDTKTTALLEQFRVWAAAAGKQPVDVGPIGDLIALKTDLLDAKAIREGRMTEPDPSAWPHPGSRTVFAVAWLVLPIDERWLRSVRRDLPVFFDFLATAGLADAAELRADAIDAIADARLVTPIRAALIARFSLAAATEAVPAEELSEWSRSEQEAVAGPVSHHVDIRDMLGPEPTVLRSVPVPSVVARLVDESVLLRYLIGIARTAVEVRGRPEGTDDWTWRQVRFQALVIDVGRGLIAGPSLRQWDSGRPEAKAAVWCRALTGICSQAAFGPAGDEPDVGKAVLLGLLAANKSGETTLAAAIGSLDVDRERVRTIFQRLRSLGAITLQRDVIRLTRLGDVGLNRSFGWASKPPDALEIPAWSPDLTVDDVVAVLTASAAGTVGAVAVDPWRQSWVESADPAALSQLLVQAMLRVDQPAALVALDLLIGVGDPAEPAVRSLLGTVRDLEARFWLKLFDRRQDRPPRDDEMADIIEAFAHLSGDDPDHELLEEVADLRSRSATDRP